MTVAWRAGNVPLPEAHLLGITALVGLHRLRPRSIPGSRVAGAAMIAAAAVLIGRSVAAAGQVDLERPGRLLTAGPYAVSRNPMYVAWALLHLGVGVGLRSAWMLLTLPAAAGRVHWEITREERSLEAAFGAEFGAYRAAVPRYLRFPAVPWVDARPAAGGRGPHG
jgi:protein-S-isoprenylcysteine O-methyltransferase Ste14